MARTSFARRRVRRITGKWNCFSMPRRFKKLMLIPRIGMAGELGFELEVLDWLEKACYQILQDYSIATDQWQYYVGYAKRQWERILKFGGDTLTQEKTSLRNEYILRGFNPLVLDLFGDAALAAAQYKWTYQIPTLPLPTPAWSYDDVMSFIWFPDPEGSAGSGYDNRQ